MGSSPLTRGKGGYYDHGMYPVGIIPAYAGKSNTNINEDEFLEDHPRLRGEKSTGARYVLLRSGSSPLTRGKAALPMLLPLLPGIIPAYAGKRAYRALQRVWEEDHPRLRGEK